MSARMLSASCLAGPAWKTSDAGRVAAQAIVAALELMAEAGWNDRQLRFFVGGLMGMRRSRAVRGGGK